MILIPQSCIQAAKKFRPHGDYAAEVEKDFAEIDPYLPEFADSIIDIGCGLAGIDVYLKRRYPHAHLTLLDGDGDLPVYGWGETNNPYGSKALADELLEANGVRADRWVKADTRDHLRSDLVVSLVAWGFHFPLKTYDVRGFCIADLRKSYEPARGIVISENDKVARCAFTC